jgi:hypothetical protein
LPPQGSPRSNGNWRRRTNLHFDVEFKIIHVLDPQGALAPATENDVVAEEWPAADLIHGHRRSTCWRFERGDLGFEGLDLLLLLSEDGRQFITTFFHLHVQALDRGEGHADFITKGDVLVVGI